MTEPIRFTFGLHVHQPVGNFDRVFEEHLRDVYRPLLAALEDRDCFPITLHLSGPLLDWLDTHASTYLDVVGRLAADGKVELLLSGYDEPILAVLSREDRLEQIDRMRRGIQQRFGVRAIGLWLTERVWEPDLAVDLAHAGVEYVLVDDRHFLVTGFPPEALHRHFRTESGGASLAVFPIDQELRYLVPFRPPAELAEYLRALRRGGHPLAILADDGEKFGGWPGTKEWVYERGWMKEFLDTLEALRSNDEVELATFSQALIKTKSGGLAYLPSASYREMEGWSLPPAAAVRMEALEKELGESRVQGPDGALIRGSHWRNFFVKYSEANRMHKKMMALSRMCRERGDPAEARRAIGRAQCNDAYWHGVFGGLYLPHLRQGIWKQLARAEALLRKDEPLSWEIRDLDGDGSPEVWIHSASFSALLAPARGAAIEEWTIFDQGCNFGDTLTRRREAYHFKATASAPDTTNQADPTEEGSASIHDIEARLTLDSLPPIDREQRALFIDRVFPGGTVVNDLVAGTAEALRSWDQVEHGVDVQMSAESLVVSCAAPGLSKRLEFHSNGDLRVAYQWDPSLAEPDAWFTTELSLARPSTIETDARERWNYPIETVAQSERGFDRTNQGEAVVLRWPLGAGTGWVKLGVG